MRFTVFLAFVLIGLSSGQVGPNAAKFKQGFCAIREVDKAIEKFCKNNRTSTVINLSQPYLLRAYCDVDGSRINRLADCNELKKIPTLQCLKSKLLKCHFKDESFKR